MIFKEIIYFFYLFNLKTLQSNYLKLFKLSDNIEKFYIFITFKLLIVFHYNVFLSFFLYKLSILEIFFYLTLKLTILIQFLFFIVN